MKMLFKILNKKPKLYEQTKKNMWESEHISKGMLKAHLDESLDSATRNLTFVEESVDWISSILPPKDFKKLLDLGCGPGIYTELLCKKGYQVAGIDISPRSIQYAIESAHKKNLPIQYTIGDYTNNILACEYDVITLIYCDLGVLSNNMRKALLRQVYDALLPNGVFLFDVFTPLKYQGMCEHKSWDINENGFWHEKECISFYSFYRYEEDNTFLQQYTILTKEQEISQYNIWEHTFTRKELEEDLRHAGFEHLQFYKNVIGDECQEDDDTICVLAKK